MNRHPFSSEILAVVLLSSASLAASAAFAVEGTAASQETTAPGGTFLRSEGPRLEIRGSERSKSADAKRLLRGQNLDYGVWFDTTVWSGMWVKAGEADGDSDLKFVRPGLVAYVSAEPFPTSFSGLADAVIRTVAESTGATPVILLREIRRINGNDMMAIEISVENGLESVRAFCYTFSNDMETIRFLAYGSEAAMQAERGAVESLLDGLVLKPPSGAGGTGRVSYRRPEANPSDSSPVKIGGDICPPILRTRVEPVYPETVRLSRESGVAILEAIIEADGGVSHVAVLKATREPLLDEAAVRAVSQWEYEPATKGGKPVSVYLTVTVNFQLH